MNAPRFYEYKTEVISTQEPQTDHYVMRFKLLEPTTIDFLPGQFVQVIIPGIPKPASFSLASSPADKQEIELTFHKVGAVTGTLAKMTLGATCTMRAPLGRFTYTTEDGDVVALAGGVGITPFMSAMRYLRDLRLPNQYTLFYSAKKKEGLIYFDELEKINQSHNNLRTVFTTTDELIDEWPYEHERINAAMIKKHVPDYKTRTYYLCGPKPFIDAMIHIIKEDLNIPEEKIKRELW